MRLLDKVSKKNVGKRAKIFGEFDCTIIGTGKVSDGRDYGEDRKRYLVELDDRVGKTGLSIATISAVPESLWVEEEEND